MVEKDIFGRLSKLRKSMPTFNKKIIPHEKFYLTSFSKNENAPYFLFIHGGPGFNCGVVEYLIENEDYFSSLNFNLILYDQRGCGRSSLYFKDCQAVTHADNINDLIEISEYLSSINLKVNGFIGHSYGAKLLFDFIKITRVTIPSIFVSTSDSILVPRLNNIALDFAYLKRTNPEKYLETLEKMDNFDLKKIWELTEELAPLFQENTDRQYFYWANLSLWEKCKEIQARINLPMNPQVLMEVRKDLYSNEENFSADIESLSTPYLWINGIHDYISDIHSTLTKRKNITPFFKSAHYPHIEENDRFCQLINKFIFNIPKPV
jgi:proline iminopeptidase